jgi:hypothetical protein
MGESVDFGAAWDQGYDPSLDVTPAGAGADPFADAPPDAATPEVFDTGIQPGGDSQLSPFSPNQGWDFTDALRGTQALLYGNRSTSLTQRRAGPAWSIGPGGSIMQYTSGSAQRLPFLPTSMDMFDPNATPLDPNRQMSSAMMAGAIIRRLRAATGLRVSAHGLVQLIVRYGFPAVVKLTGLAMQELLFLFMREKGVKHHRRGPGLYTIARTLRRADGLRARVARILRGVHAGGYRHHRAPYRAMRRRKGRR